MTTYIKHMLVLLTAVVAAGCAMTDAAPPPLAGPSEMALSLGITANPDVLSLDGSSQTLITVEARDHNGQLVPNVPLRLEILADGQPIDFGTLSARTIVTGSNGRASFTYTAPSFVEGTIPNLQVSVTPTGTDSANHVRRVVSVRLVPPSSMGATPTARFTFVPESPAAFTDVRFDGSTSTPGLGSTITSYVWEFGDGTSGTGQIATHQYKAPGNYIARLTVTASNGLSNTSPSQTIVVSAGAGPTSQFVFSPEAPTVCTNVFFNGTVSTPGENHTIVSYSWNWGDGSSPQSGSTRSHRFTTPGNYVVVLTVRDEVGQTATSQQTVAVEPAVCP